MSHVQSLTYEQKHAIHAALAETTTKHLDADESYFVPLEFDPIRHQSQDLNTLHLSAIPTTKEQAEELITQASPRTYAHIKNQLINQEHYTKQLSKKRHEYRYNGNVVHLNTHQSIEDIIAFMAARSVVEFELMDTSWESIINNNFTIISRGVSTMGAFGFAAPEAVRLGGHVFFSFPRSDTITRLSDSLKLEGGVSLNSIIDENNKKMRTAVSDFMPGMRDIDIDTFPHPIAKRVGYIATSGTLDAVEGSRFAPEAVSLQEASPALVDMLSGVTIAPIVTWDRGPDKDPILVTGELTSINKTRDLQRIQEWHRRTLARNLGLSDDSVTIRPLGKK